MVLFEYFSVIQNLYILVLCILVWWRPERTEQSVTDRMGLVRKMHPFFLTKNTLKATAFADAVLLSFYHEYRLSSSPALDQKIT